MNSPFQKTVSIWCFDCRWYFDSTHEQKFLCLFGYQMLKCCKSFVSKIKKRKKKNQLHYHWNYCALMILMFSQKSKVIWKIFLNLSFGVCRMFDLIVHAWRNTCVCWFVCAFFQYICSTQLTTHFISQTECSAVIENKIRIVSHDTYISKKNVLYNNKWNKLLQFTNLHNLLCYRA